jgi:hypothetical protein
MYHLVYGRMFERFSLDLVCWITVYNRPKLSARPTHIVILSPSQGVKPTGVVTHRGLSLNPAGHFAHNEAMT